MAIVALIISLFSNQDPLFKVALIILIAIYSLFALIVYIQLVSLNKILNQVSFSPIFKILALIHFGASLALLVAAVLSL